MRIGKSLGILAPLLIEGGILTLRDKKRRLKKRLNRFKSYFTPRPFTEGVNHDSRNMAGSSIRAHSRLKMDQSVTNIYDEASVALDKFIRANLG